MIIPSKDRLELSFEFDVSFFLKTRNQSGVVFYLGSSLNGSSDCHIGEQNISFMLVHLLMGKLQVVLTTENGDIKELNHGKQVDNGDNYFIRVSYFSCRNILSIRNYVYMLKLTIDLIKLCYRNICKAATGE